MTIKTSYSTRVVFSFIRLNYSLSYVSCKIQFFYVSFNTEHSYGKMFVNVRCSSISKLETVSSTSPRVTGRSEIDRERGKLSFLELLSRELTSVIDSTLTEPRNTYLGLKVVSYLYRLFPLSKIILRFSRIRAHFVSFQLDEDVPASTMNRFQSRSKPSKMLELIVERSHRHSKRDFRHGLPGPIKTDEITMPRSRRRSTLYVPRATQQANRNSRRIAREGVVTATCSPLVLTPSTSLLFTMDRFPSPVERNGQLGDAGVRTRVGRFRGIEDERTTKRGLRWSGGSGVGRDKVYKAAWSTRMHRAHTQVHQPQGLHVCALQPLHFPVR